MVDILQFRIYDIKTWLEFLDIIFFWALNSQRISYYYEFTCLEECWMHIVFREHLLNNSFSYSSKLSAV